MTNALFGGYKNDNIIKRFDINGNLVIYTPFSKPTGNCTVLISIWEKGNLSGYNYAV